MMQQPADHNLLKPKNNTNFNGDALPKNFKDKKKEKLSICVHVHIAYFFVKLICQAIQKNW